jgi:HD-like signal output (HDOD) protein
MLAGLMHNIGALPIIAYAEKYPQLASSPELLNSIIERTGTRLGGTILKRWKFDQELITVASECHNWDHDAGRDVDYCDLVILAQLYSVINTPEMDKFPKIDEVPAFSKLPLGRLGPKMTLKIMETAQDDIKEIENMLR